MITIRKSEERGHADHGWLDTRHTFSFADYYDPHHMGFRSLRVINEDHVAPGKGFPPHSHKDMEIITYVLQGAVQHRDSMGTSSVIKPGDVQRMSAGTGVTHSEYNPSSSEPLHLLQIWILPERNRLAPEYEQRSYPADEKRGRLRLVASRDGRDGSVKIHQDAALYVALLGSGERVTDELLPGRHAWVQVARGNVRLNDRPLAAGDGAAISDERRVTIEATADSEVLLFDLA